jgi:hypothetical protein
MLVLMRIVIALSSLLITDNCSDRYLFKTGLSIGNKQVAIFCDDSW